MRRIWTAAICATILSGLSGMAIAAQGGPPMLLTSSGFEDGGVIPQKFGQGVPNPVSPPLAWTNAPAGTASFVLLGHDPDGAPGKNSQDVTHWLAFNIPGTMTSLPEGVPATAQMPDGMIQAKNTRGQPGFLPFGSPVAYHHYTLELYALDAKLNLGPDATREQVMKAMDGHVLGKAAYEGRFHR
jgi:Raf kinase inhibitor-like YbhB/YbcL family protein